MAPCQTRANWTLIVIAVAVGQHRNNPCTDFFQRRLLRVLCGPTPDYSSTSLLLLGVERVGP